MLSKVIQKLGGFVWLFAIIFTLFSNLSYAELSGDFDAAENANRQGDRKSAFTLYQKAADAGDHRAFGKLASLYLYGKGVKKDYQLAYAWFGLAKISGDKYGGQFQKAAASSLTKEQIKAAEAILSQLKTDYGINESDKDTKK